MRLTLLFRGSRDGFSARAFHLKCDDQGMYGGGGKEAVRRGRDTECRKKPQLALNHHPPFPPRRPYLDPNSCAPLSQLPVWGVHIALVER